MSVVGRMVIIVQGGAGKITDFPKRQLITIETCKQGYDILRNGGSATDAVQKAVVELENSQYFNAGTGSVLSIAGKAEMDAAIMTNKLEAGAVAVIENVKNPILVARKVMEETDHILLVGKSAQKFARRMGFPKHNTITSLSKKKLENGLVKLREGKVKHFPKLRNFLSEYGTVGACAIDKKGAIAVATSTGGMFMHLPGRVGDTPVIGAGTYACKYGAVSCTGWGESIMRICLAKTVCDLMKKMKAQSATNMALKIMSQEKCSAGIIAVDRHGNFGFGFNTQQMLWAAMQDGKIVSC